jgi:glycosyl transferase, family 25
MCVMDKSRGQARFSAEKLSNEASTLRPVNACFWPSFAGSRSAMLKLNGNRRSSLGVWLINLDRSTSRRAAMEERLGALGLQYTRFLGIDGRKEWETLVDDVDLAAFRRNVGREVLPGEIGCYASHLAVWRALIDSPHDVALVLEDDVVFHTDFMDALDAVLEAYGTWDIVKLNCIRAKQPILRRRLGPYRLNAYVGAFTGMGAYLITRSFAQAQMPLMFPMRRPIDHALDEFDARTFRHFGLQPFPSHVDDGNHSTITGTAFSAVRKYPWHARLPVYGQRLRKLGRKAVAIFGSR